MRFQLRYFIWFLLLLGVEISIALFVHDKIVRPYIGDFLVVILVYCFLRAFTLLAVMRAGVISLIFAYVVETMQLFNVAERLGLKSGDIGYVVLGSSFSWTDLLMYSLGIATVLFLERNRS